jgi:hypothetical protein
MAKDFKANNSHAKARQGKAFVQQNEAQTIACITAFVTSTGNNEPGAAIVSAETLRTSLGCDTRPRDQFMLCSASATSR